MTFLMCSVYFKISEDMVGTDLNLPANKKVIYNLNGSLFFYSIMIFMTTCMSVVLSFPSERAVFLREQSSNMYSVTAYYLGRSTTKIPFAILFPAIMSAICYYIIGFNNHDVGKFFIFRKLI